VISDLDASIREKNAKIHVGALPVVKAVESQLQQVFQNLISNALKYQDGKQPEISIGCKDSAVAWEFYVKDNGIGIDPRYVEKIFIIFQRLHDKSEYSGTGIGLAICKKIIEKGGGRIWAKSATGKGSILYFTIPKDNLNKQNQ
jgi:light-regulated signal transduction histidine kinase (bacteriophytochrome)